MTSGRMHISPRNVVANARRHDWTAERLAPVFPGMERDVLQALLDGRAVIADEDPATGKFTVYLPEALH